MLERYEVEAFLTLAEELHFGRTAERLRVSTARISQTIAKLERRVGVPLFNRTSRRVELSPVGRRLHDEMAPAWAELNAAFTRAVEAGQGVTGTLRVAFTDVAAGQLLVGIAQLFRAREPGCEVQIREAQIANVVPWLRDGEVDVALTDLPMRDPMLVTGQVVVREARMLAVPSGHPFTRRTSITLEDLARVKLVRLPDSLPVSYRDDRTPAQTPSGRAIEPGPAAETFNEILTLVSAGQGAFLVGAHARRYHARPDLAFVPVEDAPALEWGLLWRADNATARTLAFDRAAHDLLKHP